MGAGGSQRLPSLNPTTVLVVLLLGLWLLLGCDNIQFPIFAGFFKTPLMYEIQMYFQPPYYGSSTMSSEKVSQAILYI